MCNDRYGDRWSLSVSRKYFDVFAELQTYDFKHHLHHYILSIHLIFHSAPSSSNPYELFSGVAWVIRPLPLATPLELLKTQCAQTYIWSFAP